MDEAGFAQTLESIYDVAADPEHWPGLLRRLGQDLDCHVCGMITTSADRGDVRGIATGVVRQDHQAFLRRFHRSNPVAIKAPRPFTGRYYESDEIMPRSVLERTEMYQAYFHPHDMGHTAAMTIWAGEAGAQTISVSRSWRRGRFEAQERALMRRLMPHLQRSAFVSRHLRGADLQMRAAHMLLDALQQAVILVNFAGMVVFANRTAETLLRANDGIAARLGCLSGATDAASRGLATLIGRAVRTGRAGGAMRLPRASGKPHLVVVAIPIAPHHDVSLPDEPAAILCIADPALREPAATRMLVNLFGLTRAEADLAADLMAGRDLTEIAAASDRSVHTVRKLLSRVMAKTDTNRQSALVHLLGRLPHLPGEP